MSEAYKPAPKAPVSKLDAIECPDCRAAAIKHQHYQQLCAYHLEQKHKAPVSEWKKAIRCRTCGREGKPGDWSECFTVCDVCWPFEPKSPLTPEGREGWLSRLHIQGILEEDEDKGDRENVRMTAGMQRSLCRMALHALKMEENK